MKSYRWPIFCIFLVVICFFVCSSPAASGQISKDQQKTLGDFSSFLKKFVSDPGFQMNRIVFPLRVSKIDDISMEEVSSELNKEKWTFEDFTWLKEDYCNIIISDDFSQSKGKKFNSSKTFYDKLLSSDKKIDGSLKDSDERLLYIQGKESGISISYYFKKIGKQWYLIKFEDFSM